ncbi:DUF4352 domain-containing protein [Bacillus pseudomycoides]|uniref:DUF4352 domain-containing protein n=1 Tax=Bacillus pseudomycoides TaxID=64104 RepID=UPI000BEB7B6D|nr:DUF4352 domain-containing protein [Bacillus pseudomycoides]PEE34235.1 long-chain fatty acid--CoA ligase [Bacillus pseudomycoides]PGA85548.1 long-chain fatty acid--CoA ligase [Bacillus pseudomycoides]PHF35135.1 long-chain fatty acid--CoA ligase [Bacillus pseudomycoides]
MLKKIGTITLTGALAFSLSACDDKEEVAKKVSSNTKAEQSNTKKEDKKEHNIEKTAQIRDQKLTVNKVERAEAGEYDKLKKGHELVIVHVTIENVGNQKITYNPLDFYLQNGDGSIVDNSFSTSNNNALHVGDLEPNGKVTGAISFEAKKGDSKLQLIYRPNFMSKEEVKVELQ